MHTGWRGFSGALLALACAAPGVAAQTKKNPSAPAFQAFNGTLDEAFARAAERNVPVVLVAIVENEGGKADEDITKFRNQVTTDAKLAEAFLLALPIVACNQSHALAEIEVEEGGRKLKRQVCSIYRTESCAWHQKQFDAMYREYNVEGELKSPSVLVVLPDRTIQARWQTGSAEGLAGGIQSAVAAANKKLGEGLTEAQLLEVRELLLRVGKRANAQDWGASYVAGAGVLAITQRTAQAEAARTAQALALTALERQRDEGLEWLKQGRAVDGYKRLLELASSCTGTPLEKELPKLLKAAESAKESKDAIAAYRRELEADELWRDVEALVAEKHGKQDDKLVKKAEPKIRSLCRKYADTAAGKRARERYPALAAEEDAKKQAGG